MGKKKPEHNDGSNYYKARALNRPPVEDFGWVPLQHGQTLISGQTIIYDSNKSEWFSGPLDTKIPKHTFVSVGDGCIGCTPHSAYRNSAWGHSPIIQEECDLMERLLDPYLSDELWNPSVTQRYLRAA